jgi:hypothetical protein
MRLGNFNCASGIVSTLAVDGDLIVRNAIHSDQPFIDKLQKENSYAVGFIQKTIWEKFLFCCA